MKTPYFKYAVGTAIVAGVTVALLYQALQNNDISDEVPIDNSAHEIPPEVTSGAEEEVSAERVQEQPEKEEIPSEVSITEELPSTQITSQDESTEELPTAKPTETPVTNIPQTEIQASAVQASPVETIVAKLLNTFDQFSSKIDVKGAVCVSAPGKVLIAGGYIVLEHPNIGITVSTSSRFYTTVELTPYPTEQSSHNIDGLPIIVESPQFHSTYYYTLQTRSAQIIPREESEQNEFVEKCLILCFAFIQHHMNSDAMKKKVASLSTLGSLRITLRADNDFYSQIDELQKRDLPRTSSALQTLPKFMPCPIDEKENVKIAKTGLGSSAALTTSLVGALLEWFDIVHLTAEDVSAEDRRVVHNLAQLVHSNAQGKIGSGFDVASAVYGTLLYRRFSPKPFASCMENVVKPETIFSAVMLPDGPEGWSQTIQPFSLPEGMDIVLGDVCGGSSSTSMAKKVLAWKAEDPFADEVWNNLAHTNNTIFSCIQRLNNQCKNNRDAYLTAIAWAAEKSGSKWPKKKSDSVIALLLELRSLLRAARNYLKMMGDCAGVGIEPKSQTKLADATSRLPGVVGAGVPGAGGVDALFAITLSSDARERIEEMWSSMEEPIVCPLILRGSAASGIAAHDVQEIFTNKSDIPC